MTCLGELPEVTGPPLGDVAVDITDAQWELIAPLLPAYRRRKDGRGRLSATTWRCKAAKVRIAGIRGMVAVRPLEIHSIPLRRTGGPSTTDTHYVEAPVTDK